MDERLRIGNSGGSEALVDQRGDVSTVTVTMLLVHRPVILGGLHRVDQAMQSCHLRKTDRQSRRGDLRPCCPKTADRVVERSPQRDGHPLTEEGIADHAQTRRGRLAAGRQVVVDRAIDRRRIERIVACDGGQNCGHVTYGAGDRADVIHVPTEGHDALTADPTEGRLTARHTAIAGRPRDRAAGLRTDRTQTHAQSDGGRRAAARPARRAFDVPGVARDGRIEAGEFGRHRFAQQDGARLAKASNDGRVALGNMPGTQRRAGQRRPAGDVENIFDAERNAVQRAAVVAAVDLVGSFASRGKRACAVDDYPGVNPRFVFVDLRQAAIDEIDGRNADGADFVGRSEKRRGFVGHARSIHRLARHRSHLLSGLRPRYDHEMLADTVVFRGNLVLGDRIVAGEVHVRDGRISEVIERATAVQAVQVDAGDGYIVPGYIDLHVHGGAGADFMDRSVDAVGRVLAAHLRHGTTSLLATTTAATHESISATLAACRQHRDRPQAGHARLLGVHLYGPYFRPEARGCHPGGPIRPPDPAEYEEYLADGLVVTASVAPELPGAEPFVRTCVERGVRACAGHSHATFAQMQEAIGWGVRHVDHLFCAMSDRARLRQEQTYPMRGGVLEATLYFDELTTEVIADGKHLSAELLLLARKIKGLERLALVTDCNRALDMPDGEYVFGPPEDGEPFVRHDGVGLMPDRKALASSVQGMDHMVRTFVKSTGCPLWEAVRMASLTPARIAGFERDVGSITVGKRADLLVLDRDLQVRQVYVDGAKQVDGRM